MLTIKAGRELLKKLSNNMDVFTIKPGQNNEVTPSKNKIVLNQKNSAIIGRENGFNVSISSPRWIGLGHELIHISHYYDDTFISNKKTYTIPDRNLWGDGEEYATIGDPKKPITPISENGIRQDSLHPLRIYHRGSIKSNDFEEIFQQCISSNINGDLIAMLQNNKFIDSNVGKKIIQENFQLFFAFAKLKNDEAIVQKMSSQFPDEYNAFQKNPKREMFLHMARVYPNLLIKWYTSSDNKKYFNLSDDQIEKINSKLMTKFDMELWIAISEIK